MLAKLKDPLHLVADGIESDRFELNDMTSSLPGFPERLLIGKE